MNNYNPQPYFGNTMGQPYPNYQGMYQNQPQPMQQVPIGQIPVAKVPATDLGIKLQGKLVDSIDVVKAMDIPFDGSVSYFPLTDGSAIVTKQLQQDGTSRTVVYEPVKGEKPQEAPKYITEEELNEAIKKIDTGKGFKDEIKTLKRNIEDISEKLEKLSDKDK